MRFLSITTSRGLQPPSLEEKRLSREFVKTFLTDYHGYVSRMTEGVVVGIPERPVGVFELIDEDETRVLSDANNEGQIMSEGSSEARCWSDWHYKGYENTRGVEGKLQNGCQGPSDGAGVRRIPAF